MKKNYYINNEKMKVKLLYNSILRFLTKLLIKMLPYLVCKMKK